MKKNQNEFVFQLFALLVALILVHAVYVTLVRPKADAILEAQAQAQAAGENYVATRSLFVVMRDYEQEACFVLFLWAIAIMGFKARGSLQERKQLQQQFIRIAEGTKILPDDAREYTRQLQSLPEEQKNLLLPRTLITALQRFGSTHNITDVSGSIKENVEAESDYLDSELSMIRYIAWAIPSIGFIGTVRGIGEALAQAHRAVEGDIAGVTESLGVAFNSTFVALVISIVIMFLMHQLQLSQERLVLETQRYCDNYLLRHMQND